MQRQTLSFSSSSLSSLDKELISKAIISAMSSSFPSSFAKAGKN